MICAVFNRNPLRRRPLVATTEKRLVPSAKLWCDLTRLPSCPQAHESHGQRV